MKVFKFSLFFLFINILFISNIKAQNHDSAKVEIIQDYRIEDLVKKHIALNEKKESILGYRVQIFFDSGANSRERAINIKTKFLTKYPDESIYILFQEPNYKVRVGDFRTRMDAKGFLNEISKEYENAFIVRDEINFPKLNLEKSEKSDL